MTESAAQEHLDCDITVEIVVVCLPYLAHAPFADHLEEAVPAEDRAGLKRNRCAGVLRHTQKLAALSYAARCLNPFGMHARVTSLSQG